jgi:hypothetical protein
MEKIEREVLRIIQSLPVKVISYEPIKWKRVQTTPIYIINAEDGKYVLKMFSYSQNPGKQILHLLFGNLGLQNQLIIYKYIKGYVFFHLCIPLLVASDSESYLLFKFINIEHKSENEIKADKVIDGLIEFYNITGNKITKNFKTYLINITRKPNFLIIRRSAGGLRSKYGINLTLKVLKTVFGCLVKQKSLSKKILIHNDFHHNNSFLDTDGKFYISDFENSVFENRWVLIDIVHYCVGTQTFAINTAVIKRFYVKFSANNPNLNIDFRVQLLMALLLRVSQMVLSTVPPNNVKKRYFRFLDIVLLNSNNFEKWTSNRFSGL